LEAERPSQRDVLYAVIETMSAQENGNERKAPRSTICAAGESVPRGFYRFGEFRQPKRAEADLHDKIQTIALKNASTAIAESARNSGGSTACRSTTSAYAG